MIKTMSALLDALRQQENELLRQENVTHPGTIGDMYEGLTQDILRRATEFATQINVASGFIVGDQGALSRQLDCMVVRGQGEPVPYTSRAKFPIDDVIAVVEVKKDLYSRELRSGYENLTSVSRFEPVGDQSRRLFRHAYEATVLRPLPISDEDWRELTVAEQMIHYTLGFEARFPARIVFGYDGFSTEAGLRESFASFIEGSSADGPARGFGVMSLPTLVCCGEHSLVKANGMPFCSPVDESGFWPVYLSTSGRPLEMVLEVLWTRLSYLGIVTDDVFGTDLTVDAMSPFLDGRPVTGGWEYYFREAPEPDLSAARRVRPWVPAVVDVDQAAVLGLLCTRERLPLDDPELLALLRGGHYNPETMAISLRDLRLAAEHRGDLALLTDACQVAFLPDGRIVAADNRAGQLTRWLATSASTPEASVTSSDGPLATEDRAGVAPMVAPHRSSTAP